MTLDDRTQDDRTQDDVTREDVMRDDVTREDVMREDVTPGEVREDVTPGEVREDVTPGEVREDVTPGQVRVLGDVRDVADARGLEGILGGLDTGAGDVLERLRDRLAVEAEGEGLLEVAWRTTDSPVGTLLLAATERGLVRVAFANEDGEEVLEVLARRLGPRVVRAPQRLEQAVLELEEYFDGRRHEFDLPLDLALSTTFRRRVQQQLARIGYGRTATYTEVAAAVENPGAVRAVGSACATNPIPIVLPCHRVLRTDGALGGYRGGAEVKRLLLDLERGAA